MSIMNKEEWTTGTEALGITTPATLGIPDPVIQMSRATLEIPDPAIQMSRATLGIPELETHGSTGGISTGPDGNGTMVNSDEKGTVIH